MVIRQSETYKGGDWWEWSVWVDGTEDELDGVARVEWRLHPTFPNPVRIVEDRASMFRLDTAGWGTFVVHAVVYKKEGSSARLRHVLELHYPDGTLTQA